MKAHRTDNVSLVFGVLFLIISAWWLINGIIDVHLARLGWLLPLGLIGLGLAGVVASLRGDRPARRATSGAPVPAPAMSPRATVEQTDTQAAQAYDYGSADMPSEYRGAGMPSEDGGAAGDDDVIEPAAQPGSEPPTGPGPGPARSDWS